MLDDGKDLELALDDVDDEDVDAKQKREREADQEVGTGERSSEGDGSEQRHVNMRTFGSCDHDHVTCLQFQKTMRDLEEKAEGMYAAVVRCDDCTSVPLRVCMPCSFLHPMSCSSPCLISADRLSKEVSRLKLAEVTSAHRETQQQQIAQKAVLVAKEALSDTGEVTRTEAIKKKQEIETMRKQREKGRGEACMGE